LNIDTTNQAEANCKCDHQPKWFKLDETINDETASSLSIESLNNYRECLQAICEEYTLDNIWNINETSLY
ncbi:14417_t:CDS:2, partial [Cetraspora pellucida]